MSVFVYSCQRFLSITLTLVSLIYVQVVTSPQDGQFHLTTCSWVSTTSYMGQSLLNMGL